MFLFLVLVSSARNFLYKELQKVSQTILNLNVLYLLICLLVTVAETSGQTKKMNPLDLKKWTLIEIESELPDDNVPKQEIAARSNRKGLKPLPAVRKQLPFTRIFTRSEYQKITFGHIPKEMEDKWFIFFENDKIYFHRSWTGFCMFEVALQPTAATIIRSKVSGQIAIQAKMKKPTMNLTCGFYLT